MIIQNIFAKPINRPIEGVIKADDLAQLKLEVEEYVFTNEISKRLSTFFSAYNDYQGANGAWISGFFGSGKSHLLKMLAFLLENRQVDGMRALDYFLSKCGDDAILKADMQRAVSIPSRSILFNIDQKADTITRTDTDAVLSVFVKVFNEMCGYYGKQGYVAKFERDLDERGLLESFMQNYRDISGRSWEDGRDLVILEGHNIDKAYAKASGLSSETTRGILDHYRQDYKVSVEDFAEMVHAYVQKQEKGYRLNFFVDEMGQYVAGNIRLMTNLQTIAESLATRCKGQSMLIVTAQEDMQTVLGDMGRQQANDFTRIQDRFKTRLKLTSANVDEVIQKRLLQKNAVGETELEPIYIKQKNNFGTLFEFSDGSQTYRNFRNEEHFTNCYPFIPYQFTLFHTCIENLSRHSAFEGRHTAVGERSMLGVFQQVVQAVSSKSLGELATFDLMFEGIRTTLMTQIQSSIQNAEQHLENKLAIRLLKALFLVKYVKGFKASHHNLRILMLSKFDEDIIDLGDQVAEALNLLEQQTYIQRNGDFYEFLTDDEKDIEQEIKNTEVETSDLYNVLDDYFYSDIVRDRKIRYEDTGQDFPFTKKIDDQIFGREQELAIHLITPMNEHVDNFSILQANSLGKSELLVVLPSDSRLVSDLFLYKKTDKYIRQNAIAAQSDTIRRILSEKSMQNTERASQIKVRLRELVGKARLFALGTEVEVSGEEPLSRVLRGFSELIVRTYPNLRMLKGVTYKEDHISQYIHLAKNTPLATLEFTEAEQEIMGFIQANNRNGIRTSMKSLEEKFTRKPYGWDLAAIQCLVAKLCGRGKVEARSDANLLEDDALERALKNTHAFPNVILEPQIDFTPSQIRRLKDFYNNFFDSPPVSNEARALGIETGQAFRKVLDEVEPYNEQIDHYPFLSTLQEPIKLLKEVASKPYTYFFTDLTNAEKDLLELKETCLDPIRRFMKGPNKTIYDEIKKFIENQQPNFPSVTRGRVEQMQTIMTDPGCFKGNQMRSAKSMMDQIQTELKTLIDAERDKASKQIMTMQSRLHAMEDYQVLKVESRKLLDDQFEEIQRIINRIVLIPIIRDTQREFELESYRQILTQMSALAHSEKNPDSGEVGPGVSIEYVPIKSIMVDYSQGALVSEEDVEKYLTQFKVAILDAIHSGKRIQT